MAVNILEESRPSGHLLGRRVDDAVEARRAREHRRTSLRAVSSAAPGRRMAAKNRASAAVRQADTRIRPYVRNSRGAGERNCHGCTKK